MTTKVLGFVIAACVATVVLCTAGAGFISGHAAACTGQRYPSAARSTRTPVGSYTSEQRSSAATIVSAGVDAGVPARGWVIAVAVAIQESSLRNLTGGPDDSVGLFQQRPSQGWGTREQLLDPVYASRRFYTALLAVPGWQQMPLTDAGQAVQRSAYPDAYARWEQDATMLVAAVGSELGSVLPPDLEQCLNTCVVSAGTDVGGCVEAVAVFGRAQFWLMAWSGGPVPYLSSSDPADWFQGYRRDCSGYVSMALGLPGPGLDTAGLATRSMVIAKSDLRPGDLLINPAPSMRGHVVLFERWTDTSMSLYFGYEQTGSGGTHHRVIPYPYFGDYQMAPYRFGRPR